MNPKRSLATAALLGALTAAAPTGAESPPLRIAYLAGNAGEIDPCG